ncbi:MAG TPA: RNA polymerase sigma factor RpoD/SigA [Fibrobacteraceae bacterium]|nr:RNA polymerase sigma factor RpoD/SigA [Fibrobacteraceae bacterium]
MIAKTSQEWNERAIYFQYLNEVARYPLLSLAEERALIRKASEGHRGAMDRLVRANLRFVVNIANMYKGQGLSIGELINEGNLGLMEAARRFDADQKIKFISYAVWWIRQSITRAISEKARMVRISAEKELVLRKLNRTPSRMKQVVGGTYVVDTDSLEGVTRYNAEQIEKILQMGVRTVSLDAPVGEDGDSTLLEVIPSNHENTDARSEKSSERKELRKLFNQLGEQEREVLQLYYGFKGDYELNLLEIGRQMGLSKERVRQIKENALARLRELKANMALETAA